MLADYSSNTVDISFVIEIYDCNSHVHIYTVLHTYTYTAAIHICILEREMVCVCMYTYARPYMHTSMYVCIYVHLHCIYCTIEISDVDKQNVIAVWSFGYVFCKYSEIVHYPLFESYAV